MKKRILSFILALSMMISVFPVGAFAADTGGSTAPAAAVQATSTTLTLVRNFSGYYPVDSNIGSKKVSGDGWSYVPGTDGSMGTLTISRTSMGEYQYDFTKTNPLDLTSTAIVSSARLMFNVVVTDGAELCAGVFENAVTAQDYGVISGGVFAQKPRVGTNGAMSEDYHLTFGTDGDGSYYLSAYGVDVLKSAVKAPSAYIMPNSQFPITLTLSSQDDYIAWDVTVDGKQTVLNQWAGAQNVTLNGSTTTFTAVPLSGVDTVTIQPLTRLVLDDYGWPLGTAEGTKEFQGYDSETGESFGWNFYPFSQTLVVGSSKNLSVDFGGKTLNKDCKLALQWDSKVSNAVLKGNELDVERGTFENCAFENVTLPDTGIYTDCLLATNVTGISSYKTLTLRASSSAYVSLASSTSTDHINLTEGKAYLIGTPKLKITLADGETITSINGMAPRAYAEDIQDEGNNQVTFTPKAGEDVLIVTDKADEVPLKMADGKPVTTGVPQVNGVYYGTGWTYDPNTPRKCRYPDHL